VLGMTGRLATTGLQRGDGSFGWGSIEESFRRVGDLLFVEGRRGLVFPSLLSSRISHLVFVLFFLSPSSSSVVRMSYQCPRHRRCRPISAVRRDKLSEKERAKETDLIVISEVAGCAKFLSRRDLCCSEVRSTLIDEELSLS